MVCRKCQSVLEADSAFCPKCGQRVEPAFPQQQTMNQCPHCGRSLTPGAVFCVGCGQRVQQPQTQGYTPPPQKQKKSRKKLIIIAVSIALILAAILATGLLLFWLFDDDPGEAIADGVENALDSGSFTVKYTASYEDFQGEIERVQGTMYVSIDTRNEDLMAQIQVVDSYGEEETYAIYDGYFTDGYYYEDVSEAIDLFFLAYEEDFELEVLVAMLMNSLPSSYNEILAEVVNQDKLEDCVSQYSEKLDDESWLEEYAGYSKEDEGATTMYTFTPNIHTFLDGSLDVFETAFRNKYQYIGVKDMLRDLRTPAKDTKVQLAFGVRNERLVRLELTLGGTEDGLTAGETVKFRGDLSDFGNTYVDEDLLAELLVDAQYS